MTRQFANGTKPVVAANHIRAGNTQIRNGELSETKFSVDFQIPELTWESVGPTGSGADNIWTSMDNLPPNARILICELYMEVSPSSTSFTHLYTYVTHGDDLTPTASESESRIGRLSYHPNSATDTTGTTKLVYIPLGLTNQDFLCTWDQSLAVSEVIELHYKGFITD